MLMLLLALSISTETPAGCNAEAVHCVVVAHQTAKSAEMPYKYLANQSLFRAQQECWKASSLGWVSWNPSPNVVESWNCPVLKQQLGNKGKPK